MEQQETRLMIELVHGVTTKVGLAVLDRIQSRVDVYGHSLEAEPDDRGLPTCTIELELDRPVDELVGLARAAIPRNVRAKFTIWRFNGDSGEEAARLYAQPVAGWFSH